MTLNDLLKSHPLVAILRGIQPSEVEAIGTALREGGVRCAETPLNSPEPLKSITLMRARFPDMLIGAGTVLTAAQVEDVARAGAQFVVSPNADPDVITATKRAGLCSMPGFFTPTEAFAALQAGADVLKLFPADQVGPAYIRALGAVLPRDVPLFAVGGIDEHNMKDYLAAGAKGIGLGSAIYKPGDTAEHVRRRAQALVSAFERARQ